jgi:CheY-like chemotaxis protein
LTVLLVEDQALIALDTEEILHELGASTVKTHSSVSSAMIALGEHTPDCAVLDLNLGKETSELVAAHLSEQGTPFVFATGYRDSASIPARFSSVPVVRKPISADALARQLSIALGT